MNRLFKGRKELYDSIIENVVYTSNHEQLSLFESIDLAIDNYSLSAIEVNEIWALVSFKVMDRSDDNCYSYKLK